MDEALLPTVGVEKVRERNLRHTGICHSLLCGEPPFSLQSVGRTCHLWKHQSGDNMLRRAESEEGPQVEKQREEVVETGKGKVWVLASIPSAGPHYHHMTLDRSCHSIPYGRRQANGFETEF